MNNMQRWGVIAGVVLLAATVGIVAYNAGVANGIAESGKIVTGPMGSHPYYGHRPFGFGWFIGPLFFVAFWLLVIRGLFWRGGRHCGRYEDRLDDWHRRAHERMWNEPAGAPTEK